MKKVIITAALLLAMVGLAFATGEPEGDESGGAVAIEYWSAAWQTFYETGLAAAEAYMEDHGDVTITVTPSARQEEVLMAAVSAGESPDIYGQFSPERAPNYMRYQAIAPLDELPGFWDVFESRVPQRFIDEYTTEDGHVYIFPYNGSPLLMIYNRRMFREAGIVDEQGNARPPSTWEEYREAARLMTQDTDGDGVVDQWGTWYGMGKRSAWRHLDFLPLYLSNSGGTLMYGEGGEPLFNGPAGWETMEFMLDIFNNGWTMRDSEGYALFPEGNIGMIFAGGWLIPGLGDDYEYGIAPIPAPEGKQFYTFLDPKDLGIMMQSEQKEAAWDFVQYLVSREQDLRMFEATLQVPLRDGLEDDAEFMALVNSIPFADEFLKALPYCVNLPWDPDYGYYQQTFNNAYSSILEAEGAVSVEEAFGRAAQRIIEY